MEHGQGPVRVGGAVGKSAAARPRRPPPPPGADRRLPSSPAAEAPAARPASRAAAGPDGEPSSPWTRRRPWVPGVVALLVAAAGAIDLVSALTRPESHRFRDLTRVVPGALTSAAAAATAVSGVLLLILARGLRRRKARAWRAAVALLAVSVVLHVAKGLDIEEAAVSAVLLGGLLMTRREFRAQGDPRTRRRAVTVGLALLAGSISLGCLLIALDSRVPAPKTPGRVLLTVLGALVGVNGPLPLAGRRGDVIGDTLLALGTLTLVTVAYLILRPAEPAPHLTADDEQRMRAVLTGKHGSRDSLGYFALRRDKSVVWSPSGKSCIAYRVLSGVMLASGDPLGDPEAWPGAIAAFLADCDAHAWTPAVMGCSEQAGEAWVRAGLHALELGDEAVVEVADWSLEGRAMRNVRQAVARVERAGYTTDVRRVCDIDPATATTLRAQAAAWRGAETERGFSMALGRFGEPDDGCCVAVAALQDGALRAFLHFVPWGPDGLSLDLMRRDRSADNGVNELLIVAALRAAADLGVRRVSLNFAVFRSALERGDRIGAGPVLRLWRRLLLYISRWAQIETLYRFNAKFAPTWVPRFVCYPSARDLPRIAIAALEAEAFLVWPSLRPRRRRTPS